MHADRTVGNAADTAHRRFLAAVIILVAIGLWIPQLGSSFRLDESATHWIVSDGINQTIHRSSSLQETPAYFILEWLVRNAFGSSEVAARMLSVAAIALAALGLVRLTERLVDRETGLIAGVAFVGMEGIAFAAGDARPYAASTAATVGAAFFLLRWLEDHKRRDAIGTIVMAALAIYLQFFAVVVLAGLACYAAAISGERRHRATLLVMMGSVALLLVPAIPQVVSLIHRRDTLAVSFPVSVGNLAQTLIPPVLALGIVAGLVIARARSRIALDPSRSSNEKTVAFAMSWAYPLPIVFFLASRVGETTLFEPRFFFIVAPGLALLAAMIVRQIGPQQARRIIVTAVAALSVLAFASVTHSPEDWRGAAKLANQVADPDTPVLIRPGFIESRRVSSFANAETRTYLLAPLSPYPIRGRITLVPYALDREGRSYLEKRLAPLIPSSPRLVYVALTPDDIGIWLRGRLEASGYRTASTSSAGSISITVFER